MKKGASMAAYDDGTRNCNSRIIFSWFISSYSCSRAFNFYMLPKVYLFLISVGGFAFLFTYGAIIATHIRFRKIHGCPPEGKCQMPGYPYTSWIGLISMIVTALSMPFIPGQASGLMAGVIIIALYSLIYKAMKLLNRTQKSNEINRTLNYRRYSPKLSAEYSKELTEDMKDKYKDKTKEK